MAVINPVVEEGAVVLPFIDPEPLAPPIIQMVDVSFGFVPGKPIFV